MVLMGGGRADGVRSRALVECSAIPRFQNKVLPNGLGTVDLQGRIRPVHCVSTKSFVADSQASRTDRVGTIRQCKTALAPVTQYQRIGVECRQGIVDRIAASALAADRKPEFH